MPKLIKKLTEAEIKNAKPKSKPYKLYDEGGLRLLVRKSGTKVWQYPYTFKGKPNTYTIGKYCPHGREGFVSTSQARKERDRIKSFIQEGHDPNKIKEIEGSQAETDMDKSFEKIGREWHSKGIWAEKHAKNILRSLESDVFPYIGDRLINEIKPYDISQVLQRIVNRDARDVAHRVCQRCEAIFDYAYHIKNIKCDNPAIRQSRHLPTPERDHRRHFDLNQQKRFKEFVNDLETYKGREYIALGLKFLVLTFVRPGELRLAKWHEINFNKEQWVIPKPRTKMKKHDHIVPLSSQAIGVLGRLHKITGSGDFIFPSIRTPHKPITDVTLLKAIKVMGYDDEISPHGFRHTASTVLNENGFKADLIEKQLSHTHKNNIRGVYNHAQYLPERKRMMQWWGEYVCG